MAEQKKSVIAETFKLAINKIFKDKYPDGTTELDRIIKYTSSNQKKELNEFKRAFEKDNELFKNLGFSGILSNIRSADLLRDIIAFMVVVEHERTKED